MATEQARTRDEPRQAVVFIHGVGTHAPMESLRSFTFGLGLRRLFSSPDRISDSAELRRLSEPPTEHRRAHTDFFELYWANLFPDDDWRATVSWYLRLLLRRDWWHRRGGAQLAVIIFQLTVVTSIALVLWAVVQAFMRGGWSGLFREVMSWQVALTAVLATFGALISYLIRSVLSGSVRYLTPRPGTIESRQAIRAEGLLLLRRLHSSGRYRRIIVVGDSLGSVIGYDLLASLWDELRHPDPEVAGAQGHIAVFDAAADRLDPGPATVDLLPAGAPVTDDCLRLGVRPSAPFTAAEIDTFQEAQFALWLGNRSDGVPWLITDLITLGSPLTYAPMLLDEPDIPFGGRPGLTLADKQGLKELPRCPPIHDELEHSRFYTRRYPLPGGGSRLLKVGHTAAVFGPTRWTNLYLPVRGLLRGDLFGGPVADSFGPGVRDVPVRIAGRGFWATMRQFFPLSHMSYDWSPRVADDSGASTGAAGPTALPTGDPADPAKATALGRSEAKPLPDTIAALLEALRLDDIARAPARSTDREMPPHPHGR